VSLRFMSETETGKWYEVLDDEGRPLGYMQFPHLRSFSRDLPDPPEMTPEQRLRASVAYVRSVYSRAHTGVRP
jgi:hypothetical protein